MKILILCPYPTGVAAGQRLKYEQYFNDWRSLGYQIDVSSFIDLGTWHVAYSSGHYYEKVFGILRGQCRRLRDLFRVAEYDLVYVFMWVTPFGTSTFERLVRKLAKRLIYDIEDNLFALQGSGTSSSRFNSLISKFKGTSKALFLIKTADHVITSSPFLNDFCVKMNSSSASTYISSSVDTDRFVPTSRYHDVGTVVIGWTGTFSSKIYLDMLRYVFQTLAKRVDFKLKVIGNFDYELPGVNLEVVRWIRENEIEDLQTFDIGVYPLPDNEWVLGKSGLKAIQYMAFGLPIVASNVGTTPLLISNGVNGLLVETEDEWATALESLVVNSELRRKLGEAAREEAVKRYSLHTIKRHYRSVLSRVMESNAA